MIKRDEALLEATLTRPALSARSHWLILNTDNERALTITHARRELLPVFSFREEAEMFLLIGEAEGAGLEVREVGPGELLPMLFGSDAAIDAVVLDPLPEMISRDTLWLVCLDRELFAGRLLRDQHRVLS
ncbi:hypothetical protein [Rubrobacter indicoceani]|uniref:hypothetical protein n=1 Tax=Rubrobacter indicoceani TaxID=2051957 RepID=UPI0013C45152|nr:hypothetical protein [Rubrobacter indicoceani]